MRDPWIHDGVPGVPGQGAGTGGRDRRYNSHGRLLTDGETLGVGAESIDHLIELLDVLSGALTGFRDRFRSRSPRNSVSKPRRSTDARRFTRPERES